MNGNWPVQVDYNLPERFDLSYIGSDNEKHRPVMIHRAPFGSMERFVGLLIEHFGGNFPTWLAPEQVRVIPMNDALVPLAKEIAQQIRQAKIRVHIDPIADKVGAKIRRADLDKVPYMLVLGKREAEEGTISVRARANKAVEAITDVQSFIAALSSEIAQRTLPPTQKADQA